MRYKLQFAGKDQSSACSPQESDDKSLNKNWSEPIFDKSTFERMKETLKMEHKVNEVVLAIINSSTVLRCRPDKDILSSNEQSNIHFIWRRGGSEESEERKYLIFNHRRIIQDERYYVVMADLNEFKMDLKIDNVKSEDEGEYICMYRRDKEKMIHEKHIYLKMLVPSFINPNGSSNTKVVVREGLTQKLTCNVAGVPTPSIDWYMSTPDGKERKLISAVDQPIRPVVKMGAQILHRKPYQTTMLFATIIGNPIHTLYWEFDHKPIISVNGDCRTGDKYCVTSDREISNPMTLRTRLTIYNLTLEDYGTYSCVVHSPFGAERGFTELVRKKERRIDTASSIETEFFPDLWSPSLWRSSQPEYITQNIHRTTSFKSKLEYSEIILWISILLKIYLLQSL
ncbi:unnamed protein product [Rodentolepis nana]|uniref:Ig-like domain-containing protein n=1 Tax=Rodentolepis nana TaxID=102285 RepID=A0A0R3T536_RODNA|nr:unnamed protein product [Rodentolepis nana]